MGSDSRASTKGGGSGASSMRGCSTCGGERRRGAVTTVSRGGGESTFYRVGGRAGRSGGKRSSGGRWCFIKAPVTEVEVRGHPFDEGEMKGVGRRFGSAPSGCGRVAHSSVDQKGGSGSASEGGRKPPGGPTWTGVDRELGQRKKIPDADAVWAEMRIGLQNGFLN
jgi:hypothetical protein